MSDKTIDKVEWTVCFVYEFARLYNIDMKQAFNYLCRYDGIDFVDRHYDFVHTQSFKSMVHDVAEYCVKNGGHLQ
ncbi:MAG: DUF3791 domain-containing protein [Bacteroidales bacterium]|nr:DUF3791 domain-containing protein [Bacteroidales bacterium]